MRSRSSAADRLRAVSGWAKTLGRSVMHCVGPLQSGYDVVRIVLATVLLLAGGLKAHQLATEPVIGTGALDSRWLLMATVEFELFFGIWLLSGILPKLTWAAALGLFALFTCVSFYKAISGHATCGCFGRVPVNPWYTTTLDVSIVFSLLRWRPKGQESLFSVNLRHLPQRAAGVLATWLMVGLPAAFAMGSYSDTTLSDAGDLIGNGTIVVLEPEKWIGKRFPLLDYIDIGDKLREGEWLVLLYHPDCPDCQRAIKELSHETPVGAKQMRVALIEVPPYDNTKSYVGLLGVGFVLARLSNEREWFVTTPTTLQLNGGEVVTSNVDTDHTEPAVKLFGHGGE
jgi:hypothetical protein